MWSTRVEGRRDDFGRAWSLAEQGCTENADAWLPRLDVSMPVLSILSLLLGVPPDRLACSGKVLVSEERQG